MSFNVCTLDRSTDYRRSIVDEYHCGYAKVAAFENCDPSFLIYRKFGWLHNRVLLHTQDELQEMESDLEALDKMEAEQGDPRKLRSRRIDETDTDSPRKELIEQIKSKMKEYDEILFRLQRKQAIKTPTKRNQNSLWNLIETSRSLPPSETLWLRQRDDLAAVANDVEKGWFNACLEDFLRFLCPSLSMVCSRSSLMYRHDVR